MRFVTLANFVWLAAYVAMLTAIVWGLSRAREHALATLTQPQAQADWDAWRDAATKQAETGPVHRRPPRSQSPPALVLLRDHFPVLLVGSMVLSSLLFATLMFVARGAFSRAGISSVRTTSPNRLKD